MRKVKSILGETLALWVQLIDHHQSIQLIQHTWALRDDLSR